MKDKTLGILGLAFTAAGTLLSIGASVVKDKRNERRMDEQIDRKLAERESKKR
jgi:hypothetical protein